MTFDVFLGICILFSLIMGTVFLCYVIAIAIPFIRKKPDVAGNADAFEWHFVIPCRDLRLDRHLHRPTPLRRAR